MFVGCGWDPFSKFAIFVDLGKVDHLEKSVPLTQDSTTSAEKEKQT